MMYTIISEIVGTAILNRLYEGENSRCNEIEIVSTKGIDPKILEVIKEQSKELESNHKLKRLEKTVRI